MARSLEIITAEIKTQIRTYPSLNVFLFPEDGGSSVSVFNLIIATVAQSIFVLENIIDSATANLNRIANTTHSGNSAWIQKQILAFQYGDIITFVNNVPSYNPVNPAHLVVTQCAVNANQITGVVTIKVAGGAIGSLAPLSAPQLASLQAYYFGTTTQQGIGFAGVQTKFVNLNPDQIMIAANIYYYGQYISSSVQANVISTIQNFLNTFQQNDFGGVVFISKLKDAIESVSGVSRVYFTSILGRPDSVPFISAIPVDIQGVYVTQSGYVIPETTAGYTLGNTITMLQETN